MKINIKLHSIIIALAAMMLFLIIISSMASADPVTCNVVGTQYKCDSWSNDQYPLINLLGENYVPLFDNNDPIWKCNVNILAKLVLDSNGKYTLKTDEEHDLGQGYSLQAKQIDVDGKKVWLEFGKDGQYIDDQIISTETGSNIWTCQLDKIQGKDNVPVLKVHVSQIYQGATDSIAEIDGIWIIDYANVTTLQISDKLEGFTLTQIVNGLNESNLGSLTFEDSISSKKITIPKYEHNYMVLDQQAQKELDDEWNNTPVLHLNKTMSAVSLRYMETDFSILNSIPYDPWERNQGNSSNCWIWAGTAALEGSHTYYNGYKDRLSIQFVDSLYPKWSCCMSGSPSKFADFYNSIGYAIPWDNLNADYQDGFLNREVCELSSTSINSISLTPSYKINKNIQTYKIQGSSDNDYISQIKAELHMNNPVILTIYAPNGNKMRSYFKYKWGNSDPGDILDFSSEWGNAEDAGKVAGHAMVIVGYHEDLNNPAKSYWVVLNSWGTAYSEERQYSNRPDGTFRMAMHPAKGYNAQFDREGWGTGDEFVTRFFVYNYNSNSNQAFIQEPAKPISLTVTDLELDKTTGQTRVVFEAQDSGYPNLGQLVIDNNTIDESYPSSKTITDHYFIVNLDPGTYNPSYRSKNGVGGFSDPIYLDQPLVITAMSPVPNFGYSSAKYCPDRNFSDPNGPFAPEDTVPVYFSDFSSRDVNKWHWDFGDGNTSNDRDPTHIYSHNGTYTVTLRVWNKWNGPEELKKDIDAYWYKACGYVIPDLDTDIALAKPFYPPWSIWNDKITVYNPSVDKTIKIQTEVSPVSRVYMPAEIAQKSINLENPYTTETTNVKAAKFPAKQISKEKPQNISSMRIVGSFNQTGSILENQRHNITAFGPLLYRTRVLTPTLNIKPKQSKECKFYINTNGLDPGDYQTVVTLRDYKTHEVINQVPVFFSVLAIPNIQVTPASLDFGTLNIGQNNQIQFTISNTGNVNLSYNITVPNDCSSSDVQGVVPAFKSKIITLSVDTVYAAQVPYSGERSVVIESNSSTNSTVNIPVTYALNTPCANLVLINAPSILNASEMYALNVTISNQGSIPWDNTYTLGVLDVGDAGKFVSSDANPVEKVNPGENATYQITLHAPLVPGYYMLAFEMYYRDANNVKRFFGWPVFIGITVKDQTVPKKDVILEKSQLLEKDL
jgi:S-layer protein (TIGR01567 family)